MHRNTHYSHKHYSQTAGHSIFDGMDHIASGAFNYIVRPEYHGCHAWHSSHDHCC